MKLSLNKLHSWSLLLIFLHHFYQLLLEIASLVFGHVL